jgi:hypothetical protein
MEAIEYQKSNLEALMDATKSKDGSVIYKKFGADETMHGDDALALIIGRLWVAPHEYTRWDIQEELEAVEAFNDFLVEVDTATAAGESGASIM